MTRGAPFVGLLSLLSVLCLCLLSCRPGPGGGGPPDLDLAHFVALRGFQVTERVARRGGMLYTLTRGDRIMKIDVLRDIDASSAATLMEEGIVSLEALYADALSPYPGDISRKIVRDEAYSPRLSKKERNGRTYTFFLLYAGERFGYGASTASSVRYKSLLGWLHCESLRKLYKVRVFTPPATPDGQIEELFLSMKCP